MDTTTVTSATVATETAPRFRCGEAVRYIGPDAEQPVNRSVLAPYGAQADILSFRRYEGFGSAEVMTSRGSRSIPLEHLAPVEG